MSGPPLQLFGLGLAIFLLGWLLKISTYLGYLFGGGSLAHPLFPKFFSHIYVALGFYALPLLALVTFLRPTRHLAPRLVSLTLVIASLGSALHLNFHNDATFVTAFWSSLWLTWFAFHEHRRDATALREGQWLARTMIAMIFLGGAVGKFTSGYWSGEVLHDIYFQQKNGLLYTTLRAHLDPTQITTLARWLSRGAVLGESLLVLLALITPFRLFVVLATATMLAMVLISTPFLLSVMAPPLSVLVVALLWTNLIDPPTSKILSSPPQD